MDPLSEKPVQLPPLDVEQQLTALANSTRRAVYDIVRAAPSSVGTVAAQLPVSQPAVSQHLRVLTDARLVWAMPFGAQRIYRADPAGLQSLRTWIDGLWDDVLDSSVAASGSATDEVDGGVPGAPTRKKAQF